MGFFDRFFRRRTPTPPPVQTIAPVQSIPKVVSGPTRPGTDVQTFRETGVSVQVQSDPRDTRSRGGASVRPGGGTGPGVVIVTPEEQAGITGRGTLATSTIGTEREQFAGAVERGKIAAATPPTTISPTRTFFGLTTAERESERLEAKTSQKKADIFERERKAFFESPLTFEGREGVEREGDVLTITPGFFDKAFEGARQEAFEEVKAETRARTPEQIRQEKRAGTVSAGAKVGVGTGEFAISTIGQLQQQVPTKPFSFGFGGGLGKIRDAPLFKPSQVKFTESPVQFLKEGIGTTAGVTGGIIAGTVGVGGASLFRRTKQIGFLEATSETASAFSPLSLKSGTFTITTPSKVIGTTVSKTRKGGKFQRTGTFADESEDIKILLQQEGFTLPSGEKVVTGTSTVTQAPAIRIGGGGGFTEVGLRTTTASELGIGTGLKGTPLKDIGGIKIGKTGKTTASISDSIIKQDIDFFAFQRQPSLTIGSDKARIIKTGGIRRELDFEEISGISEFAGGTRRGVFGKPILDVKAKTLGFETEGIRFKPTVKGTELNLDKFRVDFGLGKTTRPRKTTAKTKDIFAETQDGTFVLQTKQVKVKPDTSLTKAIGAVESAATPQQVIQPTTTFKGIPPSQFAGTGLFERTVGGVTPPTTVAGLSFETRQDIFQPSGIRTTTKTKARQRERLGFGLVGGQAVVPALRERQAVGIGLVPRQTTGQVTKQTTKLVTGFGIPTTIVPPVTPPFKTRMPFGIPPLFLLPFPIADTSIKRKRKKAKKKKPPKRKPSLVAIGLGITSPEVFKGERTSLGIRPILVEPKKKRKTTKKKKGKKK